MGEQPNAGRKSAPKWLWMVNIAIGLLLCLIAGEGAVISGSMVWDRFARQPQGMTSTSPAPTVPPIPNPDGLSAYYPFHENADDESGNGNDGRVIGASLTLDRNGKPDSAYEFNGIDNYIRVEHSESLSFTSALTIAVWMKTNRALPFAGIVVKADPVEPRTGYDLCVDDHQKLRADVYWDHSASIGATVISETEITDGRWHFVAFTYDGIVTRLYINGTLEAEKVYRQGARANTEPLLMGWDQNTWLSHRHFEGILDEVWLYHRALDTEELRQLMEF
jgi:hypothetical protein